MALVLVAAGIGCTGRSGPGSSAQDELVAELVDRYVSERHRFYPIEAVLAGVPNEDASLGSFRAEDIDRRVAQLVDYHKQLTAFDPTALSESAYIDVQWLTSWVKLELFVLEELEPWRLSPAFYGEILHSNLIESFLRREPLSDTELVVHRLGLIPAFVEQAVETLDASPEAHRLRGLALLRRSSDLLGEVARNDFGEHRRGKELERSITSALGSLERLTTHVDGVASAGTSSLGEERLQRYWLYSEMSEWSLDAMEAAATRQVERLVDRLDELLLREFPGERLSAVLTVGSEAEDTLDYADVVVRETVRGLSGEAWSRLDARIGVAPLPPYVRLPFFFRLPPSLAPEKEAVFFVTPGEAATGEFSRFTYREIGGELLQHRYRTQTMGLLRKLYASPAAYEGWNAFVEEKLIGDAGQSVDTRLLAAHLHYALREQMRLVAALRFHRGSISRADARHWFQERLELSFADADREVLRIAVDPGVASSALGFLMIELLRRDFLRRRPFAEPEDFYLEFLSLGAPPLRLARYQLLGDFRETETEAAGGRVVSDGGS